MVLNHGAFRQIKSPGHQAMIVYILMKTNQNPSSILKTTVAQFQQILSIAKKAFIHREAAALKPELCWFLKLISLLSPEGLNLKSYTLFPLDKGGLKCTETIIANRNLYLAQNFPPREQQQQARRKTETMTKVPISRITRSSMYPSRCSSPSKGIS